MTKKIIIALVIIALLIGGFVLVTTMKTEKLGSAPKISEGTLMGSATDFISWPNTYYNGFATTTDSGTVADAGTITQDINVKNYNELRINAGLVGGTATSTPYIKFQTSPDNENFFDITGNSTSTDQVGTSTLQMIPKILVLADPGTVSTTQSFVFDVSNISNLRIMFRGDNLSTDPNDGVQGWVNYQLFGEY